jgi:hypothetical protein
MTDTATSLEYLHYLQITYQSRPIEVSVRFAECEQSVETLEGAVTCQAGDAILTGIRGEQWPVPATAFSSKYLPAEDQQPGEPGRYVKRLARVSAVQLKAPLEIKLSGDRGTLQGKKDDWCVWYGPDDAAIVAQGIFCESYELAAIPVFIGLGKELTARQREQVRSTAEQLNQTLLPNTPLICLDESDSSYNTSPLWIHVALKSSSAKHAVLPLSDISIEAFQTALPEQLNRILKSDRRDYSWERLKNLFGPADTRDKTLAAQLAATEQFNTSLLEKHKLSGYYIEHARDPVLEPKGLERIFRIGEIADHLAGNYQERWQRLVLATTKEIANLPCKGAFCTTLGLFRLMVALSLITLGLIAALGLASFSELGGGCGADDLLAITGCNTNAWKAIFGPGAFVVYLLALLFAWQRYAQAKLERWEAKHQDYRLLAECLRVFYVRSLLGKITCVVGELPPAQRTESSWVRLALRSLFHAQPLRPVAETNESKAMQWVESGFIQHQVKYHQDTLFSRREKAIDVLSAAKRWGFRLFGIAFLILVLDVLIAILIQQEKALLSPMGRHWVLIAQVVGLAFWGAMNKVIDVCGWEQEIQRGELVLHALKQAEGSTDPDKYLAAAGYFLQDQEAWHALHRSKPVEAATGA